MRKILVVFLLDPEAVEIASAEPEKAERAINLALHKLPKEKKNFFDESQTTLQQVNA